MTSASRYAIYLAPTQDSDLWRFGCAALGRDAASAEDLPGYAPAGFTSVAWRAASADARRYGFHATLKAPLRLTPGASLVQFEAAIGALAATTAPFDIGKLIVSTLPAGDGRGFVALRPATRSAALEALEARAVRELDAFRAPPSAAEYARRRPERLTERQRGYLDEFGYPYALEEFRLHFTLSDAVERPADLAAKIAEDFARRVPDPNFRVNSLVLFAQASSAADFHVKRRFPFAKNES